MNQKYNEQSGTLRFCPFRMQSFRMRCTQYFITSLILMKQKTFLIEKMSSAPKIISFLYKTETNCPKSYLYQMSKKRFRRGLPNNKIIICYMINS